MPHLTAKLPHLPHLGSEMGHDKSLKTKAVPHLPHLPHLFRRSVYARGCARAREEGRDRQPAFL